MGLYRHRGGIWGWARRHGFRGINSPFGRRKSALPRELIKLGYVSNMSRSLLLFLIFLIGLAIFIYYLSTVDTDVEPQLIEEPVADEALEN